MTSQKRDRLVAAVTVNVVFLLIILVAVMVYQLVTIFVINGNKTDLEEEISQITDKIADMEYDIEYYQTLDGVWNLYIDYELYK